MVVVLTTWVVACAFGTGSRQPEYVWGNNFVTVDRCWHYTVFLEFSLCPMKIRFMRKLARCERIRLASCEKNRLAVASLFRVESRITILGSLRSRHSVSFGKNRCSAAVEESGGIGISPVSRLRRVASNIAIWRSGDSREGSTMEQRIIMFLSWR